MLSIMFPIPVRCSLNNYTVSYTDGLLHVYHLSGVTTNSSCKLKEILELVRQVLGFHLPVAKVNSTKERGTQFLLPSQSVEFMHPVD